ncbi:MAG: sterol-binding protein [Deltaproteobacteria bacterium]|nr:MAG: sterol-binding protein [Deltaproteobacteria bacterium]
MSDVQSFFNDTMPTKLAENPDLSEIGAVYQFDIEGAGIWTIDLTQTPGVVTEGEHDDPGCVVSCEAEDFASLLENPANGMMLFTMGKLKVSDVGLALSLQKIIG